ncbi:hypothetical protein RAMLITH_17505 [Ramlibacter sp. RBP-2]|uniref:Uncharacterized protein n=1 Tax=Ramlibacter lithotrophicus TaxID=2606681 RepID=A0A7X6DI70_9BURK|nr:hypothetical protein [Ramlibacter lithotrophicus]NKE67622.1 hypothetical protein [Ramlibacter lithotrophicus]
MHRQNTDPTLKWLLNERAALVGRIARLQESAAAAQAPAERAQRRAEELAALVAALTANQQAAVEELAALDVVLAASYPAVNPAAGGVVRATTGKYGHRGALREFLLSQLRRVAPKSVGTGALARLALAEFNLRPLTERERTNFRKQLRIQLRKEAAVVEELPVPGQSGAVQWRWRAQPSFGDIARELNRGQDAYAIGPEVGCQRTGSPPG